MQATAHLMAQAHSEKRLSEHIHCPSQVIVSHRAHFQQVQMSPGDINEQILSRASHYHFVSRPQVRHWSSARWDSHISLLCSISEISSSGEE